MTEIFKDIPNYEGKYQASNLGNIKCLIPNKEKILKPCFSSGYKTVSLILEKRKQFAVHQLVAMAFLNHTPCRFKLVVDHINNIKTDNRAENLQILTNGQNVHKSRGERSSKYDGVYWNCHRNIWTSFIKINKRQTYLGIFENEIDASISYNIALANIEKYNGNNAEFRTLIYNLKPTLSHVVKIKISNNLQGYYNKKNVI